MLDIKYKKEIGEVNWEIFDNEVQELIENDPNFDINPLMDEMMNFIEENRIY